MSDPMITITQGILESARTERGGWKVSSFYHLGVRRPLRKGWIQALLGRQVPLAAVEAFLGMPLAEYTQRVQESAQDEDPLPPPVPPLLIDFSRIGAARGHREDRRLLGRLSVSTWGETTRVRVRPRIQRPGEVSRSERINQSGGPYP